MYREKTKDVIIIIVNCLKVAISIWACCQALWLIYIMPKKINNALVLACIIIRHNKSTVIESAIMCHNETLCHLTSRSEIIYYLSQVIDG